MTSLINDKLRRAARIIALALIVPGSAALRAAPDDEEAARDAENKNQVNQQVGRILAVNVFQGSGTAQGARRRSNLQLKLKIAELDRICTLSDQQKAKLQLAGQGDIEQFFDRYEELRLELEPMLKKDPQAWQNIWPKFGPLQQKFSSGLLGDGSFFGKVLRKTLTSEQQRQYEKVQQARRRFHYLASIETTLATMEDNVALSPDQHEALARLLAESPPPLRTGQYDTHVVTSRIRRLPKDKFEKLFDARQRTLLLQNGNLNDIDQYLLQQGYLSKEEVYDRPEMAAPQEQGIDSFDVEFSE